MRKTPLSAQLGRNLINVLTEYRDALAAFSMPAQWGNLHTGRKALAWLGAVAGSGRARQDQRVAIDTGGEGWQGEGLSDLAEFLRQYQAGGYLPATVEECACPECGGLGFEVSADADEGCAQLACQVCGTNAFAADSEDYWEDADPEPVSCACGGMIFAAAVGFALRPDGEVRWVSVGLLCLTDGTLGVCADWKIDYSPSRQLLESPVTLETA